MVARMLCVAALALVVGAGCEITASAYVEHDFRDPSHPAFKEGLARAEIKVSRLVGRDAKSK
jgi:hypothetical protein